MKNKYFIILLIFMLLTGCGQNTSSNISSSAISNSSSYSDEYEICDSYVSNILTKDNTPVSPFNTLITLRTFSKKDDASIFPLVEEKISFLHMLFDRYNYYEVNGEEIINLRHINESYGTGKVLIVDQYLIDLLKLSVDLSNLTEGYFNPTMGELIDAWSTFEMNGKIYDRFTPYCLETPDIDEKLVNEKINNIIPHNELSNYIVIDDENNTIEFKKYKNIDKVTISLGAIAKGYAIEEAKRIVSNFNVSAMIDGGSSSSYGIGLNPNPERDTWIIGIASPYKDAFQNKALVNIELKGTYSLSVSGDYENSYFFYDNNKNRVLRHHILNPNTGYPENYYRVVSLWSDSRSDILDALSTAIFNIGDINKINKIIKNIENQYGLDIEYLLEKEIDFNNQKIDLYITIDYGAKLIAYNKKILNKIFDVNKEGDYSENN